MRRTCTIPELIAVILILHKSFQNIFKQVDMKYRDPIEIDCNNFSDDY